MKSEELIIWDSTLELCIVISENSLPTKYEVQAKVIYQSFNLHMRMHGSKKTSILLELHWSSGRR
jgi:hypothetical protein